MQKHAIETCGLTRRFGAQLAVDDLNLLAPEAGVYGFLGPNGAGKTTTIRMLLGLIRPDAGEVRLFGAPLAAGRLSLMRMVGALLLGAGGGVIAAVIGCLEFVRRDAA
jgi:lantibiotic transport system ATP-binding protein